MVAGSGFKYEVNMYLYGTTQTRRHSSVNTLFYKLVYFNMQPTLRPYLKGLWAFTELKVARGSPSPVHSSWVAGLFDSWQGLGILFSTGSEMQFKTCTHCHGLRELAQGPRSSGLGLGEALRRNMLYIYAFLTCRISYNRGLRGTASPDGRTYSSSEDFIVFIR